MVNFLTYLSCYTLPATYSISLNSVSLASPITVKVECSVPECCRGKLDQFISLYQFTISLGSQKTALQIMVGTPGGQASAPEGPGFCSLQGGGCQSHQPWLSGPSGELRLHP